MEILRLQGYTEQEKLEIARQYLVKKQREQTGLSEKNIVFNDDAILEIIRYYTREAGVRNLEREIGNVCRKVARKVVKAGAKHKEEITAQNIVEFLGVARFRDSEVHEKSEVGLVTGLAWTEVGGSILTTEVQVLDGKGKLTITGQLGDVMQESAQAALSYIRSKAQALGLSARVLSQRRHPPARARGRDSQGRPLRRHHHGDGAGQRARQDSGAARHRHDRRDHAARQGAAHRRIEREAAGRAARRHL